MARRFDQREPGGDRHVRPGKVSLGQDQFWGTLSTRSENSSVAAVRLAHTESHFQLSYRPPECLSSFDRGLNRTVGVLTQEALETTLEFALAHRPGGTRRCTFFGRSRPSA